MFGDLLGKVFRRKTSARVESLYQRGASAYRSGRYAEAARCAGQAIELDPSLAAVHFLRGNARLELR